jgi:hypothetical protein
MSDGKALALWISAFMLLRLALYSERMSTSPERVGLFVPWEGTG